MGFDLEKQLTFYGAYHHNPVNVAIHIACVPVLLLTGIQFGTNTPELLKLPFKWPKSLPLNLGTTAALVYSALYIALEPIAGLAVTPIIIAFASFSNKATQKFGAKATKISASVHAISWILQFIGHGKFEGRAPALLDNLVQALFLAPFFVWLEILFKLGYRPELKKRLDERIQKELSKLKAQKAAKKLDERKK